MSRLLIMFFADLQGIMPDLKPAHITGTYPPYTLLAEKSA